MNILSLNNDLEDEMVDTETGEVIQIEHTDTIPDGLTEEDNETDTDTDNNSPSHKEEDSEI